MLGIAALLKCTKQDFMKFKVQGQLYASKGAKMGSIFEKTTRFSKAPWENTSIEGAKCAQWTHFVIICPVPVSF